MYPFSQPTIAPYNPYQFSGVICAYLEVVKDTADAVPAVRNSQQEFVPRFRDIRHMPDRRQFRAICARYCKTRRRDAEAVAFNILHMVRDEMPSQYNKMLLNFEASKFRLGTFPRTDG